MGVTSSKPPPPVVLVPPLFERNFIGRERMVESSYDLLFSKLPRSRLFGDYFLSSDMLTGRIMLQPPEDRSVDLMAEIRVPYGSRQRVNGWAAFRWQKDEDDPDTFVDLRVSTEADKHVRLRSCFYNPDTGVGVFAILPVVAKQRREMAEKPQLGLRYSTDKLSVGVVGMPADWRAPDQVRPATAWAVGRYQNITGGVQYRPSEPGGNPEDLRHWNFALCYGTAGRGPLAPSFDFCLELLGMSKFVASYYHHLVLQRTVKNPMEEKGVVGITNYVDVGLEIDTRIDGGDAAPPDENQANLQFGASWQVNKNVLVKAKVGSLVSAAVFAFKSWSQPSVTCAFTAGWDHSKGRPIAGAVLSAENFGGVRYERADPNYRMRTPTRKHEADPSLLQKYPLLAPEDGGAGVEGVLPKELKPVRNVL